METNCRDYRSPLPSAEGLDGAGVAGPWCYRLLGDAKLRISGFTMRQTADEVLGSDTFAYDLRSVGQSLGRLECGAEPSVLGGSAGRSDSEGE